MIRLALLPPTAQLAPPAPPARPDVAFAALPLFDRLARALRGAARFRDACRAADRRRRWGVPELFFFEPDLQAEWSTARPPDAGRIPRDVVAAVARRSPADAQACTELPDLVADALTVLTASVEARHAARAVPGLPAAVAGLAADHPGVRTLADLLAVADDEVVRVIHPAARAGFRVWVRGVTDVHQFHALLADAVTGDPARGRLPGARPDPRVLAAYRGGPAGDPPPVAVARFQLFRPDALRPDGTVPAGLAGSDGWLWGPEPLTAVPRVEGERTVLLGDPAFRATWDAERKLPWVPGELELVEVMTANEVVDWIAARTGRRAEAPRLLRVA